MPEAEDTKQTKKEKTLEYKKSAMEDSKTIISN